MRDVIDVMVEHKSDVVPGNMGEIIHGKLVRGGTCTVCALQVQATYAMAGLRPLYLMRVVHFARKYRSGGCSNTQGQTDGGLVYYYEWKVSRAIICYQEAVVPFKSYFINNVHLRLSSCRSG